MPANTPGCSRRLKSSSRVALGLVILSGVLSVPTQAQPARGLSPEGAASGLDLMGAEEAVSERDADPAAVPVPSPAAAPLPLEEEVAEDERSQQRLREYLRRLLQESELTPEASADSRFPTLGSAVLDAQLAGYISYVETVGVPDVLIVGSSRALQGIDPEALRSQLAGQGYDTLKVYNFSVNGATAQVVNFVLSQLLPGELPRVIVWGDGSRAFNDGRRDLTWESLIVSPGYQSVMRGEPPMLSVPSMTEPGSDAVEGEPVSRLSDGEVDLSVNAFSNQAARELSAQETRESTVVEARPVGALASVQLVGLPPALNQVGLNALGFSAIADRFDPVTYYREFPRVNGRYDGAYSPFSLQGNQSIALADVASFVARQNAQLVFVNLPLSDSYLDDFRLFHEGQFQQFLQTQSVEQGFSVVDLLRAWQGQPDLFADPSHINQHGAAAIAAQLALEPNLLSALAPFFPDAVNNRGPETIDPAALLERLLNPSR